jgi:hypothetical protein
MRKGNSSPPFVQEHSARLIYLGELGDLGLNPRFFAVRTFHHHFEVTA